MAVSIARWYKRERLDFTVEFVTPAFLGNWEQKSELRAAPFKALLRYWWRVVEGHRYDTPQALYEAESALFGSAGDAGQSRVQISVHGHGLSLLNGLLQGPTIDHPEVEQTRRKVGAWLYLGYGPISMVKGKGLQVRPPLAPAIPFKLMLSWPSSDKQVRTSLKQVLSAIYWFGAVGARSRNGWGSLCLQSEGFDPVPLTDFQWQPWKALLERPYLSALGQDEQGYLLWRTRSEYSSWEEAMEYLAKVYVDVRTHLQWTKPSGEVDDRHLLGYPVGDQKKKNHMVRDWDDKGFSRHASMLRLIVRREAGTFKGMVLHVPHAFGAGHEGIDAKEVWQRVHKRLDSLMARVS